MRPEDDKEEEFEGGEEEVELAVMREQLAPFIGRTILDISENDEDESPFIMLLFDDGNYLKFPVGEDGFESTRDCDAGEI